jgi:hypothetical protein
MLKHQRVLRVCGRGTGREVNKEANAVNHEDSGSVGPYSQFGVIARGILGPPVEQNLSERRRQIFRRADRDTIDSQWRRDRGGPPQTYDNATY